MDIASISFIFNLHHLVYTIKAWLSCSLYYLEEITWEYMFMAVNQGTLLNLNESILRMRGARGISMNNELVKNAILLRTSLLVGTSMADSFTVKSR